MKQQRPSRSPRFGTQSSLAVATLGLLILSSPLMADGGIGFQDLAADPASGIDYLRAPSARSANVDSIIAQSPIPIGTFFGSIRPNESPQKGAGAPGVALLDYDGDGDLDIYVTNGPGAANSLFANQLVPSGSLSFVDVAAAAGVEATDQDSSGVCFGDTDNDGDSDLYVLGTAEGNRFFQNEGDGTFSEITGPAGVAGGNRHSVGCSFADLDGDGLLDLVVANAYDDWGHRIPVFGSVPIYPGMEHNILFHNQGGNTFADISVAAGLEEVSNMAGEGLTGAAFTWAVATADYDLDGDVDILFADNQGSAASPVGYLRLYQNDGNALFTEVTTAAGLNVAGGWMGLDFADFNCDGHLDFFATDLGFIGLAPSRWFLANGDGTFTDSGAGNLLMTPFGWGTSAFDYDNDGDSDVVYHGSVDLLSVIIADNPGVVLQNTGQCSADFSWDQSALSKDHRGRVVEGVAVGDLNGDGFEDIVSVSNADIQVSVAARPITIISGVTGSPFEAGANFEQVWSGAVNPGNMTYLADNGRVVTGGSLSVEISSADNGNGWAQIEALGSAGILHDGTVPRDGIGAVVFMTPEGGNTSARPVIGGSSYASQDALAANFGLGTAGTGTAEVLWPGGVRNRLYGVHSGEKLVFPHIPCSFDADWRNFGQYSRCVGRALNRYRRAGEINIFQQFRFKLSAVLAFFDHQYGQ